MVQVSRIERKFSTFSIVLLPNLRSLTCLPLLLFPSFAPSLDFLEYVQTIPINPRESTVDELDTVPSIFDLLEPKATRWVHLNFKSHNEDNAVVWGC